MTESFELPHYGRWSERWGHFAPQILSVCVAVAIVLGIKPRQASLVSLLVGVGLITLVVVTWLCMRAHDRRLCEDCAAAMPLNPTRDAARYRRRFFLSHQAFNPYYLIPYVLVLIGSNFLTGTAGRYVWAAVQLTMVYLILSNTTHRRLQPWCPWCSDEGGGEEFEQIPEPDGPRGDTRIPA